MTAHTEAQLIILVVCGIGYIILLSIAWKVIKFVFAGPAKIVWSLIKGLAESVFYTGKGLWLAARAIVLGACKAVHWMRTRGDKNASELLEGAAIANKAAESAMPPRPDQMPATGLATRAADGKDYGCAW